MSMRIQGFVVRGTGAQVVHQALADALPGYQLNTYSRWWELAPWGMRLFSAGNAHVLHSNLDYGALFARAQRPLVVTAHGYLLDQAMRGYSSPLQRLHYRTDLRWLTMASLQRADRVVAVSHYLANLLRADLNYQGQIDVIHNGVDTERFHPALERSRQARPLRVLFCGQLSQKKGAHLLAPMAARLGPEFEIWLTASASETSAFLGGALPGGSAAIKPVGKQSPDEMPELMRQVELLWAPSVREGFGLCVAEGMASGLPVVTTDGSALPELLVTGKGGFLCPLGDVNAFASALRLLAADPSKRQAMGEFNRARIEAAFSLHQMTRAYASVFESVCDNGSNKAA